MRKILLIALVGFAAILILKHPVVATHIVSGVWLSVRGLVAAL